MLNPKYVILFGSKMTQMFFKSFLGETQERLVYHDHLQRRNYVWPIMIIYKDETTFGLS